MTAIATRDAVNIECVGIIPVTDVECMAAMMDILTVAVTAVDAILAQMAKRVCWTQ